MTFGAVEAGLVAERPGAGAAVSGQSGGAGVRRVRGWLRSAREPFATKLQGLLGAVSGPWWRAAQAVVGQAPGWLTRLRRFLWSSFRYFFGGVSGLYRHGRPSARPPETSP
ncbi:MAG: hypothetical protein ACJ8CN_06845 [Gemmatimonadales bacterium]